jgi:diadenosine tetraphosphate (Ap4A) HIT family hydrolase
MTITTPGPCRFCNLPEQRILLEDKYAYVVRDSFPVSPGHTLIILRRHLGTLFETTKEERLSMFELMDQAKRMLDAELHPDAYNIGLNDGAAAGQTIPHLHWHLMPRYKGDRSDPQGGVRWIFPDKARYKRP